MRFAILIIPLLPHTTMASTFSFTAPCSAVFFRAFASAACSSRSASARIFPARIGSFRTSSMKRAKARVSLTFSGRFSRAVR